MTDKIQYPGSLHNHTDYSNLRLRDSINTVDTLVDYAIELGHNCVAITEHECLSNSIKIENKIEKVKKTNPDFKVIRGNEIYLCRNNLTSSNYVPKQDRFYHFVLLAKDEVGYQQISELSSRAWNRSFTYRGMERVPTYYSDIFQVIGDNPGHVVASTACFRKGTKVETKNGWKEIQDIQSGDYVINRYGEWEKVIEPTCNWFEGTMYEIEFSGNENSIICTDNHQFLTITGDSKIPKWTQAKDLYLERGNKKHICLNPIRKKYPYYNKTVIKREEFVRSYFKDSIDGLKKYVLPDTIEITPELMRLFGLFLGDGYLSLKKNPRLGFTLNIKELDSYYETIFKPVEEQLGIKWQINKREEFNRADIVSTSVELIDLFHWIFGDVKADTKYIPDRLKINDELSYELIFGYFLADGYFRLRKPNKTINCTTGEFVSASISKQLSYDFYELLNSLGITTNISLSNGRVDKNGVNHQDSWHLIGSNKFLGAVKKEKLYNHNDVCEIFKNSIEYKKKDFQIIDDVLYRKIRIKKRAPIETKEYVYCLNNTTHSFKCENLIVHNCLGGVLPTQLLRLKEEPNEQNRELVKKWCLQMENLFGKNNFYLEMQPSDNKEQIYVNNEIIKISEELDIPFIITNDAHYLKKDFRPLHKAFLTSQDGDRETDMFYSTTYLMSTKEVEDFMGKHIGKEKLERAYSNINLIRNNCKDFSIKKPLVIPQLRWKQVGTVPYNTEFLKDMPILTEFLHSENIDESTLGKNIVHAILNKEDLQNKEALDMIEMNLDMIRVSSKVNNASWASYLLNLQEIIENLWKLDTLVGPGRGSGVGFLLLYALDITQINPLRENTKTFPWRFLNPKRVSVLD